MTDVRHSYELRPLADVARASVDGVLPAVCSTVTTDTRALGEGALFVALVAARDGHDFVAAAEASGASGAVVERSKVAALRAAGTKLPLLAVDDTLVAYGDMARAWRRAMPARVIGVTGSNGKTTGKELAAAVLAQSAPTLRTEANYNNRIGVPRTLFNLRNDHAFAVVEMGMNQPGEIAELARIAEPDAALVTSIARCHLEGVGGIDGVIREKQSIFAGVRPGGACIVNRDDPRIAAMPTLRGRLVVSYGTAPGNDVRLVGFESLRFAGIRVKLDIAGRLLDFPFRAFGRHSALAAASAAAVGLAFSVAPEAIVAGLSTFESVHGRFEPLNIADRHIIDDSYNANPESVIAGLDTMKSLFGTNNFIAVLGEMFELGAWASECHTEIGEHAATAGARALIAFGGDNAALIASAATRAGIANVTHTSDPVEAATRALALTAPGDGVIIKGSRGVKLERVVAQLTALSATQHGGA